MKPLAKVIVGVVLVVIIAVAVIGAAVIGNVASGGEDTGDEDELKQATPEDNEPTATADPVEQCLEPVPTVGDGPGATEMTIDDRPVQSDAIENRLSTSLFESNDDEFQTTQVSENLSVVARQHAEAAAGGNTYDYTVADGCELSTAHTTVLNDDITTVTSASIADSLQSELTDTNLETIRADHDAVGIGVYLTDNGEIHLTVATLDTSN